MFPKWPADNVKRSYFRHSLHRISVALLISMPSKNSVILTVSLSCNSKGLVVDLFFPNRKRNKCLLAAYSCDLLFTDQHIDRS